jgi:hypothetical protein
MVWILTQVLGIVALVLGLTLVVNGIRLRRRMGSSDGK